MDCELKNKQTVLEAIYEALQYIEDNLDMPIDYKVANALYMARDYIYEHK